MLPGKDTKKWSITLKTGNKEEIVHYNWFIRYEIDNQTKQLSILRITAGIIQPNSSRNWSSMLYIMAFNIFSCIGGLHKALIPNFEGKESFKGRSWHTAEWPADRPRVVVHRIFRKIKYRMEYTVCCILKQISQLNQI